MSRRINLKRWRNKDTGELFETYESWSLVRSADMAKKILLYAEDSLNGIKAPPGYLWVKVSEQGISDSGNWVEA